MIELQHVRKSYGNCTPIADITATVHRGDVVAIIGPSGTGKSTLLRMINALEEVSDGHILIEGADITNPTADRPKLRQKVGMVFQSFHLFGHMSVIENIMMAQMDLLGRSKQEAYDKAMQLLRQVGLADKALSYPDQLSGGQKQRAAIARTLAMDPEVLLLDEPTSALDPRMVSEVEAVIHQLAQMGKTMLIVTHEMRFARKVSNRVFYLDEGGIYEDGPTEEVFTNAKREKTRKFLNHHKMLEIVIRSKEFDFPEMQSKLLMYGYTHQLGFEKQNKLLSIFEELCRQILLPVTEKMRFTVECGEQTSGNGITPFQIVCEYGETLYKVEDTDNAFAWKLLQHAVQSMEYEEIKDIDVQYKNRLKIMVS